MHQNYSRFPQKRGLLMNVFLKKLFILLLCFLVASSMISCQFIETLGIDFLSGEDTPKEDDEKKNNKFPPYTVYFVETYEEILEAIEIMKSHGTIIEKSTYAFDCEGMIFKDDIAVDIKFTIVFDDTGAEPLEEGQHYLARNLGRVSIGWYLYDTYYPTEVGKDYSRHIALFCKYVFCVQGDYRDKVVIEDKDLLKVDYGLGDGSEQLEDWDASYPPGIYAIHYDGHRFLDLEVGGTDGRFRTFEEYPTPEFMRAFIKTIVLIE